MSTSDADIGPERAGAPQWRSTDGRLLIQRCEDCDEKFHYPRAVCPFCLSSKVRWVECSGEATVYSYSILRRGEPYALALVTLAEGPRLMTNIVDCSMDEIAIGQAVSVTFRDIEGVATPMFRPSRKPSAGG